MNEIRVRAAVDILFDGGVRLAEAGAVGYAIAGMKPSRPQHYGLVPVRWAGRSRAFWVEPAKLECKRSLAGCVTAPPAEELDLTIPEGAQDEISFGRNLRLFRRARGYSQAQLAREMSKLGMERISQTSVSNWENRAECPSGSFLTVAARALGVPAFAFFVRMECVKVQDTLEYVRRLEKTLCQREG